MKKQLLILVMICVSIISTRAQYTLSPSIPPFGTQYMLNQATTGVTRAALGADQVWDYSSLTFNPMYTYQIVKLNTVGQRIQDSFPTCTYLEYMQMGAPNPDLNPMEFYEDKGTHIRRIGSKGSGSSLSKQNDTLILFNQAYNTTARYRNANFTYAGYGSLKVKTNIYDSVILLIQTYTGANDTALLFFKFTPYYQKLFGVFISAGNVAGAYYWEPTKSTSGINDIEMDRAIDLFPNPATTNFNIQLKNSSRTLRISMFDITGNCVYKGVNYNKSEVNIDIKAFSKGLYMVSIETDTGIETKKLLIQ